MLPENRSKENLSTSWLSQPRSQLLLLYAALPWIIQAFCPRICWCFFTSRHSENVDASRGLYNIGGYTLN
jgi:hypothetical protein